jgi:hypothetical protein
VKEMLTIVVPRIDMTPLKNQPLHKQTDALVDAGQNTLNSGSEVLTTMGEVGDDGATGGVQAIGGVADGAPGVLGNL